MLTLLLVTLLCADRFPPSLEPSHIWYLAGVEALCVDAPALAALIYFVRAGIGGL